MDSPVGLDHRSQDTGALNPHQKSLIVDSVVDLKQIPVPILPQSVTDTRTELIEEENARISATSDGLSPSDTHLALSPTPLVKQGREADEKIDPPASEQKVEIVPLKDDPESLIMTVRSVLIGVLLSAFGVSITQLFFFKPVHMQIKLMFLQIASVLIGRSCALIPGPRWWNPGPYSLKEAGFSALMGTTASGAMMSAEMISAYELYFDRVINFGVAFGISMSAQLLGFGWAGLLQPIIIYPSRTVFPEVLPSVSLLNSLFKVGSESEDQVKFFKKAFLAIGIYEIFPTYIAPAFQAISVFCLTLPKNPLVTAIFGGARPLEGMGILSISADWSLVGGRGPLYMPRSTQVYELLALVVSTLIFFLVYSKSWFDAGLSQNFPFMSTSLLTADGKPYPYRQAIKEDGSANEQFIQRTGLPFFTATFYIVQVLVSVFLTSSITHAVLHNYHIVGSFFKKSKALEGIDPHRLACMKYKDFPIWGFVSISVVAVALALGMASLDKSGISFVGLLVALVLSFLMTLAAGFINAMAGFRIRFSGGIQMLGGLLFPGNVFGSMWFTLYGASSATQGISILRDSKYGQYIHLPQNLVVYSQLMGCTVGSLASLVVVKSILKNEREVLLSPSGDGVFSGAEIAAFQARSVSWGIFSRRMFLFGQKYSAVSWGVLAGLFLPVPFFVAHRYWPRYKFDLVNVPLFCGIVQSLYASAYAGEPMRIIIGLMSQFWARKYRPRWFTKYNYILSAALDGGTELVVFFLAMIFQGGGGKKINFPTYFLNPAPSTPRDYCFMNREARGSGSDS
ncbi:uncharacterized protein PGTG_20797 [Puccinia graminis f. sp. tritici CRL 75-36-700-3]|uniref:Oligopeptide transporter n=1 Tax=Puccinia graminis f. sp. tritici (strain CRL 75-36-700-3 / race SCCL) TaxID=418459 RepID=H6QPP2_PUCGT|nr:uncharacterized protein PGTG_20797 [Puccinia graminis f. sp. tritici CRL 75-36-700-3]EHS64094.1 hypothetical protein PGTG_20797 [Puccinia graminis f. sp. tritici CRL 75-36-700-3]